MFRTASLSFAYLLAILLMAAAYTTAPSPTAAAIGSSFTQAEGTF